MNNFVHLHNHSTFSFGDGISQIPDMVKRAKELNMNALALTDHGYGHGLIEFHSECKANGIKPILGCEMYLAPYGIKHTEKTLLNRSANHLVLLAKNKIGYKNLIKLLSIAATDGFYYKPKIDFDLLNQYKEGLICSTACLAGPVAVNLYDSNKAKVDLEQAKKVLYDLKNIFNDDLYLEIQYHGMKPKEGQLMDMQSQLIVNALKISSECGVPLVATNDCHYVNENDRKLRNIIIADKRKDSIEDNEDVRDYYDNEGQYYLKTIDQMHGIFSKDYPEAILNTNIIANKVELYDIADKGHKLPKFSEDSEQIFKEKVIKGFKLKYPNCNEQSKEWQRLLHEVKVIKTLGFKDYFLIVQDFINYAENNSISIGPGRGSAAGSIVSYCLDITTLCPIKNDLLFERFLNPERIALPDIDVDVCKDKRRQVIEYVENKYGSEQVSQIITFNRIKGKGTIRTVGRVLDIPQEVQNAISDVLPKDAGEFSISLKEVVDGTNNDVKEATDFIHSFMEKDPSNKDYIESAVALEGTYTHSGVHAAAVVIGPEKLSNILPIQKAKEGTVTQYSMEDVEALGLLKMDFLGLDTLSMVSNCLKMICQDNPDGPLKDKKIATLRQLQNLYPNLEDPKVYESVFKNGKTMGIFQCDSEGLRLLLARIKANKFADISAAIALYRPGPLDCLSGDVKVLYGYETTKNGRKSYKYKTIKELYDQWINSPDKSKSLMNIVSYNTDTALFFRNKINAIEQGPVKKLYKLIIQSKLGYKIQLTGKQRYTDLMKCSLDHKFLLSDGSYKKLQDLKTGDYIAITKKLFGSKKITKRKYVEGKKTFRDICFRNYKYKCCMCDWSEGSLDVNHLEDNRDINNSPENLCFLCPNHHRLYTEGKLSKETILINRNKYKIPKSDDIIYVRYIDKEYVGEEVTYDISVKDPYNNFIASDFVVHNSGMVESFIARRRNREPENSWHDELKPYLLHTHGLPIYQEQIMFASQVLCGFSMAKADQLRKVIGKKKKEDILAFRTEFVDAAVKTGKVNKEKAESIYSEIEFFGRYAFNLAHSAAYAVVSYYTGWLKTYYPEYFICALLNKFAAGELEDGNTKKKKNNDETFMKYILECQSMGIIISQPDINESYMDFRVKDKKNISFGLGALKGVGANVQELITYRDSNGRFSNVIHFLKVCIDLGINKKVVSEFIEANVLNFGIDNVELSRLVEGYERPKKNGQGLTKSKKTILDDIRLANKNREAALEKANVISDLQKQESMLKDIEKKYNETLNDLCKDIPKKESSDQFIEHLGIYIVND